MKIERKRRLHQEFTVKPLLSYSVQRGSPRDQWTTEHAALLEAVTVLCFTK